VKAVPPEPHGGPFDEGLIDAHVVESPHELGPVHRFDDAVDRALDRWRGHEPSDRIIYALTELADFGLLWHLIGWTKALRGREGDLPGAVRFSGLLVAESIVVNGVAKSIFERERPVQQTERPHRLRVPLTTSFPSGHASAAFVAASLLAPKSRVPAFWYALAGTVAYSRVHVRIHHASDVIGGAVLGVLLGRAFHRIWGRGR
jgi:undecaprenyl-diphosphatase